MARTGSEGKRTNWLLIFLYLLLGFAAAGIVGSWHATRAEALTRISVILQLLGLVVVAWGIKELRHEVGDDFATELKADVKAFAVAVRATVVRAVAIFRKPQPKTILGIGGTTVGLAMTGSAHLTVTDTSTVEQKLAMIEKRLGELDARAADIDRRIEKEVSERMQAVESITVEIDRRYDDLWRKVRNIAAGGVRFEILGLIWLLIGTLLPALPSDLLTWIPG
jgi:hypothetical protein